MCWFTVLAVPEVATAHRCWPCRNGAPLAMLPSCTVCISCLLEKPATFPLLQYTSAVVSLSATVTAVLFVVRTVHVSCFLHVLQVHEDEPWYCEANPDPAFASCEVPEETE